MFTVLFSSKARLEEIALKGGNHPLHVFGVARWARVWWLSITGIIFWLFWFGPFIKLVFAGTPKTWYGEITHQDTVIFFGKYTFSSGYYWLGGLLTGKFLQLLEIWSANKMQHFRRFLNYGVTSYQRGSRQENNLSELTA